MSELLWAVLGMLDSLGCDFPSITFCKAGFVAMNRLNLFLSWNILFSPLIVNDSLGGYISLGLHPWSRSFCSISIQDLLAFMVSIEKSGVSLIGLPL